MWKMLDLIAIPPTAIIYDTLMQQAANSAGFSIIFWTVVSGRFGKGAGKGQELAAKPGLAWKNVIVHLGSPRMSWKVTHLGVKEAVVGPGLSTEFRWCVWWEDLLPEKLIVLLEW